MKRQNWRTVFFLLSQDTDCRKFYFLRLKCQNYHYINVRSVKKDTKRSSNTLLCLVSFFMERTLFLVRYGISLEELCQWHLKKLHWKNLHFSLNLFKQWPLTSSLTTYYDYNVRSIKKDTKHSSVLLLRLVSFFTERPLVKSCLHNFTQSAYFMTFLCLVFLTYCY